MDDTQAMHGGTAAVVVPVYNGRSVISGCLDALLQQTLMPDAIYVVDNGSTDGTYEWLQAAAARDPRLRVLREWTRGAAAARNAALRVATEDIIAFTDADCLPEPEWLACLLEGYQDSRIGAVAGRVVGHAPRDIIQRYLSIAGLPTPEGALLVRECSFPSTVFYTGNLSVRGDVLHRISGFDVCLPSCEDTDLCWRVLQAGWHIAYTPQARVEHIHRERLTSMVKRLFRYGRSRPQLLRKHCAGQIFLLAGGRVFTWRGPVTACINLTSPEKVSLALLGLTAMSPWFALLLGLYWLRLAVKMHRAAARRGVPVRSVADLAAMTGLQVLEFLATNTGSAVGSLRHRVLFV